ncbi:transposable element Tcb1 transposase [Trichonephila clavipes]|nr:transposable element Tcb1 transposase [Trichonephila clavipes]
MFYLSGSSLSADLGAHAYAYSSAISFPNVSVSNVIENSSYDLPYVKDFNARNDSSSLIKDYKCNKIKSTKLKLSIVREKCSDIVLCKKANGAMKTSSVEFISQSPTPSPMERNYRRFSSGLYGNTAADSVRSEWPLWHAAKIKAVFARRRSKSKPEQKLWTLEQRERERKKNARGSRSSADAKFVLRNLILPRASKPNLHSCDLFHAVYDIAAVYILLQKNPPTWAWVELASLVTSLSRGPTVFAKWVREIGSRVGRNQTTIMRICDCWMQEGTTDRRGRSHLPQCTTSREDRQIVRMAVTDRSVTSRTVE